MALNGYDSAPFLTCSGVPQGSNLGPLLFLIFINGLLDQINSECIASADDIKVFRLISTIEDCQLLEADMDIFVYWCDLKFMTHNSKKFQIIYFTKKKKLILFYYFYSESLYF